MTNIITSPNANWIGNPAGVGADRTHGPCLSVPAPPQQGLPRWTVIGGRGQDVQADEEVIPQTGPGASVWFLKRGIVRMLRYGVDGRRQVLSLSFAGEFLGYEPNWREGLIVETATPCRLCRIARRDLDAAMQGNAALRAAYYRQQRDQLERLRLLTWSIAALRPDERLGGFLALATRFLPYQRLPDGTGVLSITVARADIADLLATTVESISRIMRRLAETGLVEIRDPAHLRLLDVDGLAELGRINPTFATLPFDEQRFGLAG